MRNFHSIYRRFRFHKPFKIKNKAIINFQSINKPKINSTCPTRIIPIFQASQHISAYNTENYVPIMLFLLFVIRIHMNYKQRIIHYSRKFTILWEQTGVRYSIVCRALILPIWFVQHTSAPDYHIMPFIKHFKHLTHHWLGAFVFLVCLEENSRDKTNTFWL